MFNSRIGKSYNPQNAAVKSPSNDLAVISQLAAEFADISRKNIQSWREALEAANNAETPRWSLLQDIYEYLRPDAHLGAMMDIRRGLTESTRYYIRDSKTNKEDPVKSKLLEQEWVFDVIGDMVDHAFYGYTVLQITDPILGKYDLLPRRNFIPQKDILLLEAGGENGIDVNDPALKGSIIVIKSRDKFGLLNDIVPDLIWKKNARQAWAMFSEKFGIPLVTATTITQDKKELDRIEAMLKALGKAAQAIFPTGTTIDIKDSAAKGDPYKVFLEQMTYCDAQISKRILGGTMVTDNGSSRSQGEVHERTMNDIIAGRDKKKAEFGFNRKIMFLLRDVFRFPFSETDEFVFDRSESLNLTEHWSIISKAIELGYEIDNDWLSSTFNFPITGKKEPAKTEPEPPKTPKASGRPEVVGSFFD